MNGEPQKRIKGSINVVIIHSIHRPKGRCSCFCFCVGYPLGKETEYLRKKKEEDGELFQPLRALAISFRGFEFSS